MSKTRIVRGKHIPMRAPTLATIVYYLLFKEINPQGTARGVVLTILIGLVVLAWTLFFAQIWLNELSEPEWKDK